MTQYQRVPVHNATSNGATSQAETSQVLPAASETLGKLPCQVEHREQAKVATEGTSSGRHCSNDDRLHSKEDSGKTRGVQSSITDPSTLHFVGSACDWLRFPVFGGSVSLEVLEQLKAKKQEALNSVTPVYFDLAGQTWIVAPVSDAKGSNSLPYVLKGPGIQISLAEGVIGRPVSLLADGGRGSGCVVDDPSHARPVAALAFTGQYCARFNPQELVEDAKAWLDKLGVRVERLGVPTRLDIRGDIAGLHVSKVIRDFALGRIVKRARKWSLEGEGQWEDVTGLYLGKRTQGVMARVYDKALELKKDPDKLKEYLLVNGLEELPEVLTRVEFELHSDFFREKWNARCLEDVFKNLGAIIEYLMQDWLRVCVEVDRNHTDRAINAAWWDWLKAHMIGAALVVGEKPKPEVLPPDTSKCVRQFWGCLSTMCASIGIVPRDKIHALELVLEHFGACDEEKFKEAFYIKSDRLVNVSRFVSGRSGYRAAASFS